MSGQSKPPLIDPEARTPPQLSPPEKPHNRLIPGYDDKPPVMVWVRRSWLDLLTLALCTIASPIIYFFASPILPHYFPLFPGVRFTEWGMTHGLPLRPEYVNTFVSAGVGFLVPATIMGAMGLWMVRSFWDSNAAIMGLGYALSTACLFQVFIKWCIGDLRPHWLDVCNPAVPPAFPGIGDTRVFYTADQVCTGKKQALAQAQMGFPSGHSVCAFAGFVFLALYLNAKLYIVPLGYPGRRPAHWKLVVFAAPLLTAVLLSASKVSDGWHHVTDVIAGALIGLVSAIIAYDMSFCSVWDQRTNHLPRE